MRVQLPPVPPNNERFNMAKVDINKIKKKRDRRTPEDIKNSGNRQSRALADRKRALDALMGGAVLDAFNCWDVLGQIDVSSRMSELIRLGYKITRGYRPLVNKYGDEKKIRTFRIAEEDREYTPPPVELSVDNVDNVKQ